jgi:hypothetical protein
MANGEASEGSLRTSGKFLRGSGGVKWRSFFLELLVRQRKEGSGVV